MHSGYKVLTKNAKKKPLSLKANNRYTPEKELLAVEVLQVTAGELAPYFE